jgi:hypothetical protein
MNAINGHEAFIADPDRAIHPTRLSGLRVADGQQAGPHQAHTNRITFLYGDFVIVEDESSDDITGMRHLST